MIVGMRPITAIAVFVALSGAATGEIIRFDGCASATVPPGWTVSQTHSGAAPKWELVSDPSAPSPPCAFAQVSTDVTAGRFPLAIWQGAELRDGEISVAFKPVAGTVDQAAGIVWRYRDVNNYYIVRANALENNVVLYKVQDGVRISIAPKGLPSRAYGVQHSIAKRAWSTLRVVFREGLFTVYLNGERLVEVEDQSFTRAGKTGLWTKADSVTYFDNFGVTPK
jgi:hypothetical protein